MIINLVKDQQGDVVGYEMMPETSVDHSTIAVIRDMTFFGIDDTEVVYDGSEMLHKSDKGELGNISKLVWRRKNHTEDFLNNS